MSVPSMIVRECGNLSRRVGPFPPGTGTREADAMGIAGPSQLVVDELAPFIRVQYQGREVAAYAAQCNDNMFLTLVPHGPGLGPSCCDVGDVQGAGILSSGCTAFMCHQVHSDEP